MKFHGVAVHLKATMGESDTNPEWRICPLAIEPSREDYGTPRTALPRARFTEVRRLVLRCPHTPRKQRATTDRDVLVSPSSPRMSESDSRFYYYFNQSKSTKFKQYTPKWPLKCTRQRARGLLRHGVCCAVTKIVKLK